MFFLLDYAYFKNNYRLIAVVLSEQKSLDADPRPILQIVFEGVAGGDDDTKIDYTLFLKNRKNQF